MCGRGELENWKRIRHLFLIRLLNTIRCNHLLREFYEIQRNPLIVHYIWNDYLFTDTSFVFVLQIKGVLHWRKTSENGFFQEISSQVLSHCVTKSLKFQEWSALCMRDGPINFIISREKKMHILLLLLKNGWNHHLIPNLHDKNRPITIKADCTWGW